MLRRGGTPKIARNSNSLAKKSPAKITADNTTNVKYYINPNLHQRMSKRLWIVFSLAFIPPHRDVDQYMIYEMGSCNHPADLLCFHDCIH